MATQATRTEKKFYHFDHGNWRVLLPNSGRDRYLCVFFIEKTSKNIDLTPLLKKYLETINHKKKFFAENFAILNEEFLAFNFLFSASIKISSCIYRRNHSRSCLYLLFIRVHRTLITLFKFLKQIKFNESILFCILLFSCLLKEASPFMRNLLE